MSENPFDEFPNWKLFPEMGYSQGIVMSALSSFKDDVLKWRKKWESHIINACKDEKELENTKYWLEWNIKKRMEADAKVVEAEVIIPSLRNQLKNIKGIIELFSPSLTHDFKQAMYEALEEEFEFQ